MDKHLQQLEAYKVMPLEELFEVEEVKVEVSFNDMPGAMYQLSYSGDVPIAGEKPDNRDLARLAPGGLFLTLLCIDYRFYNINFFLQNPILYHFS